ncbi:hypothetical protein Dsin_026980 [Dipteronia sinensis]|uniref:Bromodomain associated domain-containing protein n=1 Tax=Dipteronia sinensis TaxID=43782 RepID=A0AAD9ZYV2_9ROSI|nr:hypothetical protein Dsin_026980 [Dipteronia sinensis]
MKQIIKTKSKRKQYQSIAEEEDTPTELSFKLTRVAVSQIWAAQRSALETLTLITTKYLEQVAKLASSCSHESNRTQSDLFDLINALHDLSSPMQGFVGASTLHTDDGAGNSCLLNSGVLKEISVFIKCIDEIPFAKPIPRINTASLSMSPLNSKPDSSRGLHIPRWLPAFPDAGTYKEYKEKIIVLSLKEMIPTAAGDHILSLKILKWTAEIALRARGRSERKVARFSLHGIA